MKLSKILLLVFMGIVVLAIGGYLFVGEDGEETEVAVEQAEQDATADLSLEEIHYVETRGEKKEWELRAKAAQHFRHEDRTELQDLTITFYAEDGRTITMRGEEGSLKGREKGSEEIDVQGNVVIVSSDGYRVVSDSLRYDKEMGQISTSDPVLFEGRGVRITGVGAVVDLESEKLYIHNNVRTVIDK